MTRDYVAIVPTYERYHECLRAVRSVLAQSVPPIEVIVVNDGSTDRRYEWLAEIVDDPRLHVLVRPVNSRIDLDADCANGEVRNTALQWLEGVGFDGWIAFLDDDDEWVSDKMQRQFEAVEREGNCRLCCTNASNRRHTGEVTGLHHQPDGKDLGHGVRDVTSVIARYNPIINSSAMITTALQRKVGLQRPTGKAQDWHYWKRCVRHTRVLRLDDPYVYYTTGNKKAYL